MKKVAIIGGGIFGVTAALELAKDHEVILYEQGPRLLGGATYANHNRHHYGFHYPRSPETAAQCLAGALDFDSYFEEALVWDFENHYCIGSEKSRVTPEQYLSFCRQMNFEFEEITPPNSWINPSKVSLCLKVKEAVCDFTTLQALALSELEKNKAIKIQLNSPVTAGKILDSGKKRLFTQSGEFADFDFVVSAIYANHNQFCDWFGFKKRNFQFNLQELDLIELPENLRLGLTVMDGSYPSFLPFGRTQFHILAHVDHSQLVRESSFGSSPLLTRSLNITSNFDEVMKVSSEFFPILKKARYHHSIFVDRVVDATLSSTDARITDLETHGQGCYSIFAAKVITCVSTAKKLTAMIGAES